MGQQSLYPGYQLCWTSSFGFARSIASNRPETLGLVSKSCTPACQSCLPSPELQGQLREDRGFRPEPGAQKGSSSLVVADVDHIDMIAGYDGDEVSAAKALHKDEFSWLECFGQIWFRALGIDVWPRAVMAGPRRMPDESPPAQDCETWHET